MVDDGVMSLGINWNGRAGCKSYSVDVWVFELLEEVIAVSYGAVQTMDLKSRDICKESIAMEHFMKRLPSATEMIKNGRAPVLLRQRQDSGL